VLSARAIGTATITAVTQEGSYSTEIEITVIEPSVTDDDVMIGNTVWATRNVGAPGTFAASIDNRGMLYQWNRLIGWTSTNAMINSNDATAWNSTIPAGTAWTTQNDPCPPGWRVPTRAELEALRTTRNVWTTQNGVIGRLFGNAPYQVFLPAAGLRNNSDGTLERNDVYGSYWSDTQHTNNEWAWNMLFNDSSVNIGGSWRASGRSIRCVEE
jgi:uncharacterized protein (TIGR02145 family)